MVIYLLHRTISNLENTGSTVSQGETVRKYCQDYAIQGPLRVRPYMLYASHLLLNDIDRVYLNIIDALFFFGCFAFAYMWRCGRAGLLLEHLVILIQDEMLDVTQVKCQCKDPAWCPDHYVRTCPSVLSASSCFFIDNPWKNTDTCRLKHTHFICWKNQLTVIYLNSGHAFWKSFTSNHSASGGREQDDGYAVMATGEGVPQWYTPIMWRRGIAGPSSLLLSDSPTALWVGSDYDFSFLLWFSSVILNPALSGLMILASTDRG